jgi:hypothetical protein
LRDQNKFIDNLSKAQDENTGTLKKLISQNALLRKEQSKLNLETDEGVKRNIEINEKINANTEALKQNSDENVKNKINVGNYAGSIEEAAGNLGLFNSQVPGAIDGVKSLGATFKALLANPVVLVLAAIVGTLKLLYDAFKRTQEGADLLNTASAVLSALFEGLQSVVAKLSTFIVDLFTKPKESLSNFADAFKKNISNRFEGLLELVPKLGQAIKQLFEGDFSGAAKTAGDAVAKIAFGIEDFSDKATAAIDSVTEAMERNVQAALELQAAQVRYEESLIKSTTALANLNKEAELQNQIADDSTKTFDERTEASEKARIANERASKVALDLAKEELDIINIQIKQAKENGFITRQLRQEQADAIANVIEQEKQFTITVRDNVKQREEIQRDLFEKNLDFLLDNFDNFKTVQERIIQSDKTTLEERIKSTSELNALLNKTFNDQIEQIQTRTDVEIKANELIAESDSKRLIEKVRLLQLDEIEETRLLEVIRDRRTAIQDLTDLELENAQLSIDALDAQVEAWKMTNDAKILSTQEFNEELLNIELEALLTKQEQELITEAEFREQKIAIEEEFRVAERARHEEIRVFEAEQDRALLEETLFGKFEVQLQALERERQLELEYAEKIGADTTKVKEKYEKAKLKIELQRVNASLSLAADFANNIAIIAGEQTKIGKAAAIASTTITTIQSGVEAFRGMIATVPGPVGIVLGVAAAAAAVAAGVASIQEIAAVPDDPKAGISSGASASFSAPSISSVSASASGTQAQSINTEVGQGIVDRETIDPASAQQSQTVLVVDEVTEAQNTQTEKTEIAEI